jgi:hypothetical protein
LPRRTDRIVVDRQRACSSSMKTRNRDAGLK